MFESTQLSKACCVAGNFPLFIASEIIQKNCKTSAKRTIFTREQQNEGSSNTLIFN